MYLNHCPEFLNKFIYPTASTTVGVFANSWILDKRISGLERETKHHSKESDHRLNVVEKKIGGVNFRVGKVEDDTAEIKDNVKSMAGDIKILMAKFSERK
ncbi:MAG: hypothetical protein LQ342_006265 [Letrouitia transgressa]|nr:MAG: hypothetical protein LQ342_006265 [Letrouitia transgressa]